MTTTLHPLKSLNEQQVARLSDLVTEYVRVLAQSAEQSEAVSKLKSTAPDRPTTGVSVSDWNKYVSRLERFAVTLGDASGLKAELDARRDYLKTELLDLLPAKQWLRIGDWWVGVRWTDWGGGEYSVLVKKATDDAVPSNDELTIIPRD